MSAPASTAPPTSSQAEIEAELVRVVEGSHRALAMPVGAVDRATLDRYYSPELAETVWQGLLGEVDDELTVTGQFEVVEFREVEVEADGSTGLVVECGIDATTLLGPDGEVVVEGDVDAYLRRYELSLQGDGSWSIDSISFPGAEKELCGAS